MKDLALWCWDKCSNVRDMCGKKGVNNAKEFAKAAMESPELMSAIHREKKRWDKMMELKRQVMCQFCGRESFNHKCAGCGAERDHRLSRTPKPL